MLDQLIYKKLIQNKMVEHVVIVVKMVIMLELVKNLRQLKSPRQQKNLRKKKPKAAKKPKKVKKPKASKKPKEVKETTEEIESKVTQEISDEKISGDEKMFKNLLKWFKNVIFTSLTKNYDGNPFLSSDIDDMIDVIDVNNNIDQELWNF